ncbi:dipeptide ABC transporter ATP-binding protein [Vineibacter terrae]|uniref:ABC transporter ATP-binding protein n=1 Tax=Vineibacter terrae TaxID=2586908 RepID=UPI002E311784|nr:dipeptide ABC transporter ATP-binding protein [Vineibacter terrae]HEX2887419.1 dipeptide ABC transporter ATP-binding protein [Vineibacter terrae]
MSIPLLQVSGLKKHYPMRSGLLRAGGGTVRAVDGVDFAVARGETLGLVGESGCGKSTVGRLLAKLLAPTSGTICLDGQPIDRLGSRATRDFRRRVQMVFQDPYSSLNPRLTAARIVAEPLLNYGRIPRAELHERLQALFMKVGLRADQMQRYPHEFSGGQRQRVGIARALALSPSLIVCDEPVSALDVSVQAQVINLMMDLQAELGLSYLFIAHDLAVVEHISHRIAVMYLGKIVELADKHRLIGAPQHPYTQALLSAAPVADAAIRRQRIVLSGDVPSPAQPPAGCRFHTRCPHALPRCRSEEPRLRDVAPGHAVACHLAPSTDAAVDPAPA